MTPLKRYFINKALWYCLTLLIAVMLNFFLPRMIKGNPVEAMMAELNTGMMDSDSKKKLYETFNKEFGLDKPLITQFFIYTGNLLHGDLGTSFGMYPKKVERIIAGAIPWTIALQLPAILLGWLLGNALGAIVAYRKGILDKVFFPVSLFIHSIPFFALSIILLYLLAVELSWFPVGGGYAYELIPSLNFRFISSVIYHYWLPFLSIFIVLIGGQAIGMRSMAIYELKEDYVLYSKLMGVKDRKIISYVFKNGMLPQITGLSLSIGVMVAGALITEIVFNYPGIGSLLFKAIRQLDYPLISGCTLLITCSVIAANFCIDMLYGLLDPRIKAAQLEEAS